MKLETLTIKEFTNWAIKNDEITFHQTKEWASLKKENGWKSKNILGEWTDMCPECIENKE